MKNTKGNSESGQAMVELALMFSAFIFLVMIILDFGRAVYDFSTVYNAAREGARYGIVHPSDCAGINTAAHHLAIGLEPFTVTCSTNLTAGTVTVLVSTTFSPVTPMIGGFFPELSPGVPGIPIRARSTMFLEQ